jgi:hypothetical protein
MRGAGRQESDRRPVRYRTLRNFPCVDPYRMPAIVAESGLLQSVLERGAFCSRTLGAFHPGGPGVVKPFRRGVPQVHAEGAADFSQRMGSPGAAFGAQQRLSDPPARRDGQPESKEAR